MQSEDNKKSIIDNLLAFLIVFSSVPGWYVVEKIGVNKFWAIFIILSIVMSVLILKKLDLFKNAKLIIKDVVNNKINILLILLMMWATITYLINYTGKDTILYIFKMLFIVVIYFFIVSLYVKNKDKFEIKNFINTVAKYIVFLGVIKSLIAIYQFLLKSNYILGFETTKWPTFNPASLYYNVNGLGGYLYISIIATLIILVYTKHKKAYVVALVLQYYVLYLTVARTSIISTVLFIALMLIVILINDRKILKNMINKGVVITFIFSNALGICMIFNEKIQKSVSIIIDHNYIQKPRDKSTYEILELKSEKGVNNRQFIWKAVLNTKGDYILFGDGLKYSIIKKINVKEVINPESEQNTRISYHNTLFRYFASNGLIGVILYLLVMLLSPMILFLRMVKNKRFNLSYATFIAFSISLFAYMQMEEVYIGEIGLIQMVNILNIVLGACLVQKGDFFNKITDKKNNNNII